MAKQNSWHNSYDIIEKLGAGGNANVYHVRNKTNCMELALKELYNKSYEKKARFINEIHITEQNASTIPGIIPIIESNKEEYWYTMPLATPILDYVKDKTICDIVTGVIELSDTLEKLHEKGICHRDIKPSNIYYYNDRFSFGDFGLVDFPDNPDDFTKSDKGVGAIFTIAPEMKRDPKHADGTKGDVFSLAKTMWMLLSGDDRGFDGVYNYLDKSHGLRYIEKYKNIHLVELEELLKNATDNNPSLRPTIKEFKDRLNIWLDVFNDYDKAQASDWNFLNKQLFGLNPPESSCWREIHKIIEVLNIVGMTPAYNHMLFSDKGGLDFSYAELANEKDCIYIYDTAGCCYLVKPKCLYYEEFGENYRWNYFLLEFNRLNPIFEENGVVDSEYLVEDMPGHYVDAKYVQYGVYDYDTGIPLPQGYKTVFRYIKGKFLIVMKSGPYNNISGTYDGRHGLCSNTDFRDYIDKLVKMYCDIFVKLKQDKRFDNVSDEEIERRILNLTEFNRNPFSHNEDISLNKNDEKAIKQKSKKYIQENYSSMNFKSILQADNITVRKIKFYFIFSNPDFLCSLDYFFHTKKYICKDGYIKELESPLSEDCYYIYNREKAISFRNQLQQKINEILYQEDLSTLDKYKNFISIELMRCGKPSHLFTKQEINEEMRKADDRVNNQLVIDEDGYAKVIKDNEYGLLYPVRHESWHAGNNFVGKYSNLSTLTDDYISSLQGWLLYLQTGKKQYMDYVHDNRDEEDLIKKIREYY